MDVRHVLAMKRGRPIKHLCCSSNSDDIDRVFASAQRSAKKPKMTV